MTATHHWYSPQEIAGLLDGMAHGEQWRARCPAHVGDNPTSLAIAEGRSKQGNPMTLLHCFAHDCSVGDICAALGIPLAGLWVIHPDHARGTRHAPRAHSPRIERLRRSPTPYTPEEIAQMLLEEMIVSDPEWMRTCEPARAKMWELARDPQIRSDLTNALIAAHLNPTRFWERLAAEQNKEHTHG